VLADRRRLPAALVEWDRQLDLALLRVDASGLSPAVVGDSDRLRPGELVLAVGHPFGLAGVVASGIVHAAPAPERRAGAGWIQAHLRLAPGNSGGPMADAAGRVVGINAMIAGGLALAVPSRLVQTFVIRSAPP
jgi:serine protease Do